MKKYLLTTILFLSLLVGSLFTVTSLAFAQGIQDGTTNQVPANGTTGQTGGTTTNEDRGGFDWRWLLPLLAIPIILMFMNNDKRDDRSEYRSRGYAGSKGGESRREREDEEVL